MKLSAIFAVVASGALSIVVACSSSSSGGGAPSCKNPMSTGAGSAACNTCLQGMCGSQLSAATSTCGAFDSCYASCDCSDVACLVACQPKIDANCKYADLSSCLASNCQTPCTMTIGGTDSGATE